MSRNTAIKVAALAVILIGLGILALTLGPPDIDAIRARVDDAGAWGPVVFFAVYVGLALIPCPKALLTAAGGAVFGLVPGAALALSAALVGAVISFGLGRVLGRDAVDRITSGRLAQVDAMLRDHGLAAVLIVRLVPLFPFIVINYAAGLSGVRFRHYLLGSAVGMIPGSLAYAALGAHGTDPWGLAAAVSALLVLIVAGSYFARRLDPRRRPLPSIASPADEPAANHGPGAPGPIQGPGRV